MTIFDPLEVEPTHEEPKHRNLRHVTEVWIDKHPEIYNMIVRFAFEMYNAGQRFGIGLLAERVRWETKLHYRDSSEKYKISNSYRAYIARKLIQDYPQLESFIRFRPTKW